MRIYLLPTLHLKDIRLIGKTLKGVVDPAGHLALDEIHAYHGVTDDRPSEESELGQLDDTPEQDNESPAAKKARAIGAGQEHQVRHSATEVPENSSPFRSQDELEIFLGTLKEINRRKRIPAGFHLEKHFETTETFSTGRMRKGLTVTLDYEVWYPRVLLWCQELELLKTFSIVVQNQ